MAPESTNGQHGHSSVESVPQEVAQLAAELSEAEEPSRRKRIAAQIAAEIGLQQMTEACVTGEARRAGLDRRDPVTGLNDHPVVLAFHRLVFSTPSLAGRLVQYTLDNEESLAAALEQHGAPRRAELLCHLRQLAAHHLAQ